MVKTGRKSMRVAGIMSGTSLDGVDVAIVDIVQGEDIGGIRVVAYHSAPYPATLRKRLLEISNCATHTGEISRLNFLLGEIYAKAVAESCRLKRIPLKSIELIGCHGQTIFHEVNAGSAKPRAGAFPNNTLQIGEAAVIAERLSIPVVSNFRARDIAAGGHGAPLVPFVDYRLFRHPRLGRVALNIGGIANITAIPAGGKPEDVIAFDTGPGNMVMDALVAEITGGKQRFDRDGRIAARNTIDKRLLATLLRDSYYRKSPPKSAGREQYGLEFLTRLRANGKSDGRLIATAAALTASAIALGINKFVNPHFEKRNGRIDELIVSGGGARNTHLVGLLHAMLPGIAIATSRDFGIDPDAKEAIAFAILAYESFHARPGNLPSATGASHPVTLGALTPA